MNFKLFTNKDSFKQLQFEYDVLYLSFMCVFVHYRCSQNIIIVNSCILLPEKRIQKEQKRKNDRDHKEICSYNLNVT